MSLVQTYSFVVVSIIWFVMDLLSDVMLQNSNGPTVRWGPKPHQPETSHYNGILIIT